MKNSQDMKKMWKDAGILFAITLIVGLMLGFVNELTKEPIARQEELKVQNSCREVVASADSFTEKSFADNSSEAFLQVVERAAENGVKVDDSYFEAKNAAGETIGYVYLLTSSEGYGGNIELMTGILTDGSLGGVSILSISETAGLGMKAKEDAFRKQFEGKKTDQIVYTKNGAKADNEIDALSGATITTNAVTNGVNAGLYFISTLQ